MNDPVEGRYAGVDVSKRRLDVAVVRRGALAERFSVANDPGCPEARRRPFCTTFRRYLAPFPSLRHNAGKARRQAGFRRWREWRTYARWRSGIRNGEVPDERCASSARRTVTAAGELREALFKRGRTPGRFKTG